MNNDENYAVYISNIFLIKNFESLMAGHRADGGYYRGVRDCLKVVREAEEGYKKRIQNGRTILDNPF